MMMPLRVSTLTLICFLIELLSGLSASASIPESQNVVSEQFISGCDLKNHKYDIGLIVDASAWITEMGFSDLCYSLGRDFLSSISLGNEESKVQLTTLSSNFTTVISLNYGDNLKTLNITLNSRASDMYKIPGNGMEKLNIGSGLAENYATWKNDGDRPNIPNVVFLFSSHSSTDNAAPQAVTYRNNKMYLAVIGVGPSADPKLKDLAFKPTAPWYTTIPSLTDYTGLSAKMDQVLCAVIDLETTTTSAPPTTTMPLPTKVTAATTNATALPTMVTTAVPSNPTTAAAANSTMKPPTTSVVSIVPTQVTANSTTKTINTTPTAPATSQTSPVSTGQPVTSTAVTLNATSAPSTKPSTVISVATTNAVSSVSATTNNMTTVTTNSTQMSTTTAGVSSATTSNITTNITASTPPTIVTAASTQVSVTTTANTTSNITVNATTPVSVQPSSVVSSKPIVVTTPTTVHTTSKADRGTTWSTSLISIILLVSVIMRY